MGNRLLVSLLTTATVAHLGMVTGCAPSAARRAVYAHSSYYAHGRFVNQQPTSSLSAGNPFSVLWHFLTTKVPDREPTAPLPVVPLDIASLTDRRPELVRVTWLGHSSSLVEIAGYKLLLDPVLGFTIGPVAWVSPQRYTRTVPATAAQLPFIDAVLISHDHFDHLDRATIELLRDKVGHFYVPLGVGSHLVRWGVAVGRITELNWGEEARLSGLTLVCTPTHHGSGRGGRRDATLWGSWVMQAATCRLFFSGDGGYGPHFKTIGDAYGPFDLALMECGQYSPQWAPMHMLPEQTVQAALDLRTRRMLPVHWAAFSESLHPWTEPVERALAEAARRGLPLTTPRLGEPVLITDSTRWPTAAWWRLVRPQ
ncbi:MBL fold metallo-hydrolase [Hymenobacter tibetensis]|uniref:MBL fold metallo-hydrolase n=1 Tax=Hymenobacter tibetensis TaxID=497967 RepID=A0ABY4CWP9_9BACT|nr:MBL fold metallo-hydrolase [Hymenobacter tibetensis]UOG73436.1 MBL fold metallo-hydrolase [Hymenobacter tibetensis]